MAGFTSWPDALFGLVRPEIRALAPYRHAPWDPAYERLHANENPWRNPADTSTAGLNRYPEPHPLVLEARLAALYNVPSQCLIAGRGSDEAIDLLVKEVAREMTVKSGQKCTAIRRVLVPESVYDSVAQAISARLAKTTVGNPRNESVRMGAVVNREQFNSVRDGLAYLKAQTRVLHDGSTHALVDADAAVACCVGPTLLGTGNAAGSDAADRVHDTEVFGPVATLVPYRTSGKGALDHALHLIRRGQGSLVASVYGSDPVALGQAIPELTDSHGRVHVISPDVAAMHTGHGNVMPQSLHGGPGRAGGGEELGGLRALNFYHRRAAIQASTVVLSQLK
jgi:3,4-dehydroadipyl-CoA semialdehyde dehydrogenase